MSEQEKDQLIERLDASRRETLAALEGIAPEAVVYPQSGWRVKDVIGHLALWEEEVALSLQAHAGGDAYSIPDFPGEDDYNQQGYEKRLSLSAETLMAEWTKARDDFRAAIRAVPDVRFGEPVLCPWVLTSSVAGLAREMAAHEREHREQILQAVRGG